MQTSGCHFHGQGPRGHRWNHCRRPGRWNSGWSNGVACQMHHKCPTESTGPNNAARDMMHKNHCSHNHHPQWFQKPYHFCHFMHHFPHHSPHNNHSHPNHHGHSHSHNHDHCHHGTQIQSCNHVPAPSHSCCSCAPQPGNIQTESSPTQAQKNTCSVGTETGNEEVVQPST